MVRITPLSSRGLFEPRKKTLSSRCLTPGPRCIPYYLCAQRAHKPKFCPPIMIKKKNHTPLKNPPNGGFLLICIITICCQFPCTNIISTCCTRRDITSRTDGTAGWRFRRTHIRCFTWATSGTFTSGQTSWKTVW